jgi:hypothetical protein
MSIVGKMHKISDNIYETLISEISMRLRVYIREYSKVITIHLEGKYYVIEGFMIKILMNGFGRMSELISFIIETFKRAAIPELEFLDTDLRYSGGMCLGLDNDRLQYEYLGVKYDYYPQCDIRSCVCECRKYKALHTLLEANGLNSRSMGCSSGVNLEDYYESNSFKSFDYLGKGVTFWTGYAGTSIYCNNVQMHVHLSCRILNYCDDNYAEAYELICAGDYFIESDALCRMNISESRVWFWKGIPILYSTDCECEKCTTCSVFDRMVNQRSVKRCLAE